MGEAKRSIRDVLEDRGFFVSLFGGDPAVVDEKRRMLERVNGDNRCPYRLVRMLVEAPEGFSALVAFDTTGFGEGSPTAWGSWSGAGGRGRFEGTARRVEGRTV